MEEQKKLGTTYKMLRALGFNYSEEAYGDVTMGKLLDKVLGNIYKKRLEKMMDWPILQPINRGLRPWILKRLGYKVGKCFIVSMHVYACCDYIGGQCEHCQR